MNMKETVTIVLIVAIVVGIGGCVVGMNSQYNGGENVQTKTAADGLDYVMVEIEGMPCLLLRSYIANGYKVNSITCDWSKRDK